MDKQKAIELFKAMCGDEDNYALRMDAVMYQSMRKTWELNDPYIGRIRIDNRESPKITFFSSVYYKEQDNLTRGVFESFLSLKEYDELESLFFGNFKPDYKYLRKNGAIPPPKYCLFRKSKSEYMNGETMYFTGKYTDNNNKVNYWEGTGMRAKMGKCVFDNYAEALKMKTECFLIKGRWYNIGVYNKQ